MRASRSTLRVWYGFSALMPTDSIIVTILQRSSITEVPRRTGPAIGYYCCWLVRSQVAGEGFAVSAGKMAARSGSVCQLTTSVAREMRLETTQDGLPFVPRACILRPATCCIQSHRSSAPQVHVCSRHCSRVVGATAPNETRDQPEPCNTLSLLRIPRKYG